LKILVINTGSSSIKYELFDMEGEKRIVSGVAERIGEEKGLLTHKRIFADGNILEKVKEQVIVNYREGLNSILQLVMDHEYGAIRDQSEISAVGHRVVHGGESLKETILIDENVINAVKENIPLAPLHNPANLTGIEVARSLFSDIPQAAVFDTSFHQTIPKEAFLYALPLELYKKEKVRRYGFHGSSHSYVAEMAAEFLGKSLNNCNLITIHLGNGASIAAIKKGKSVDTSMGMTPLEGLVMGTRSGDIDPALPFFLADHLKMSLKQVDVLLNKESGLKGLCGMNDMREILDQYDTGNQQAKDALGVYIYRIKKYIGAYLAVLGRVDAIVFTAGIGEKSSVVRKLCLNGLDMLGMKIDSKKNQEAGNENRDISSDQSAVRILVIPTNEELKIAKETKKVLEKILYVE